MPSFIGQFPVSVGQDTVVPTGQGGLSAVLLGNASGLTLIVKMGANYSRTLYPGQVDKFPIPNTHNGEIILSAKTAMGLKNTSSYPSSYVQVDAVGVGEQIQGTYPMQLNLPAVTSTASGNPIFSATVGFGSTVSQAQSLNIYNPANSGVQYEFHSARVFTNDSTIPTCNLSYTSGADINYANLTPVTSHFVNSSPPLSTAHATYIDSNAAIIGTDLEVVDVQQDNTVDFLLFPDKIVVQPGNNLTITLETASTGHIVRFTAKWTEVSQVSSGSLTGGVTTGNILTAANVVNDNNAPGTGVISAFPSGVGGVNQLFIDNQGNITALGNALLGNILGASGINGSLHLGQVVSGDTFDSDHNGNTYFKSTASSNQSINFQPISGTTVCFFSVNGMNFNSGGVLFTTGSISRIKTFTASVTTTPTLFTHGLGAVPTGIFYIFQGTGTTAGSIQYDTATLSSTQIKLTASGSFTALVTVYAA